MRKRLLSVVVLGAMAIGSTSAMAIGSTSAMAIERSELILQPVVKVTTHKPVDTQAGIDALAQLHQQQAKTWRPNCGSSCGVGL